MEYAENLCYEITVKPGAIKVLVVDDDRLDIDLFLHTLSRCGITRASSLNGTDAINYFTKLAVHPSIAELPEIIFLDLKIGQISGFDLISLIRSNPLFEKVPVVVLSGSTFPGDEEKAKALGATAFYPKTVDLEEVKAMVEKVLNLCC